MTQQEADQFVDFIKTAVLGMGEVVANRHLEVATTCIVAFLALARQPSIDTAKLVSDLEDLMGSLSEEFRGERAFGPSLIRMLRSQLEREQS
jgi:hypothetical protein